MRHYLPSIDIAILEAPGTFLSKLERIAHERTFKADRHADQLGKLSLDVLNLRFLGPSPHQGLGVQLIAQGGSKRIAVEVRAHTWSPPDPTHDVYADAAKTLVSPLLKQYNKQEGTRVRLRVPSPKDLVPKLTPHSQHLFKRFATLANTSLLHHLDWDRFYEFVRGSRMRPLNEVEMARLLMDNGFAREYAEEIAAIYLHLWRFNALR